MDADTFRRLQVIFHEALGRPEAEREVYVRSACGEDRALADEVMELLALEAAVTPRETVRPLALAAQAVEDAERRSLIGSAIGRYRIESEIASGGMGRVFKASRIDGDVRQVVALKLMRVEMFNPALLKRFSSERKILASLNHPGIAHLIDAGTDERGTPFVAMEYVDGQPLHEYCAKNLLPIRARVELFRQVLAAVAHAHRNLVVHRDLKPDNVLVTADGRVKLLDFGIAKEIDLDLQHTATAQRFFTPAYAAPEQLDDSAVSVACDVYGLGAVLYTVLTGEPPFDFSALTQGEIERTIRMVPPVSMSATVTACEPEALRIRGIDHGLRWAKALKGDLEQIVQKALRKEATRRYASVDQFDDDLVRYLEQLPVSASGDGRFYRLRKFCERNALGLSAAAVVLLLGAFGLGHILKQNQQIRLERDRAQYTLRILQNSFLYADPNTPSGENGAPGGIDRADDPRARTILAAAAREIGTLERSRPEMFRSLAYQIGEIQLNLGMAQDSLDLSTRANRTTANPPSNGLILELRGSTSASQLPRARALIEQHRARLGQQAEFIAEEARLLYLEDRYRESSDLLEKLLEESSEDLDPNLRDRVFLYLAEAYRLNNQTERAVQVLDRQIAELSERIGRDGPATLISRLRRIELATKAEDIAKAEPELSAIDSALDRYYDRNSAIRAQFHTIAGQLYNGRRPDTALAHFRRALEANLQALGPQHENTLRAHLNVALVLAYSRQDRREAYPHFEQAIAGIEKVKGLSYSLIGFARLEAAKSYFWDKNDAAAREMLTPPHLAQFFQQMPAVNSEEYLAALYYGFGPQNCAKGWEAKLAGMPRSRGVARSIMCRYDPAARHRPKD